MLNSELPVVVIGAGPVGLAAAAQLVKRGAAPLVLEAGVVTCERRGTWIYYRLDPKSAARIAKLGHLLTAGATREPKRVATKPVLARV